MSTTEQNNARHYFRLSKDSADLTRYFVAGGKLYSRFFHSKKRRWQIRPALEHELKKYTKEYFNSRFANKDFTARVFAPSQGNRVDYDYIAPVVKKGMAGIEILYTDPQGNPYSYQKDGKTVPYTRLRLAKGLELIAKDKTGKPTDKTIKYLQPKGVGVKPYFTSLFRHSYSTVNSLKPKINLLEVEYLVITEGEFKAEALCAIGVPTVGISGIHNAVNTFEGCHIAEKNQYKVKHPKSAYFVTAKKTKGRGGEKLPYKIQKPLIRFTVVPCYLDLKATAKELKAFIATYRPLRAQELGGNIAHQTELSLRKKRGSFVVAPKTIGASLLPELEEFISKRLPRIKGLIFLHDGDALDGDEKRRLGSFFPSVRNFKLATHSKPIEVYYSHVNPEAKEKAFDDLLDGGHATPEQVRDALGFGAPTLEVAEVPETRMLGLNYEQTVKELESLKEEIGKEAKGMEALTRSNGSLKAMFAHTNAILRLEAQIKILIDSLAFINRKINKELEEYAQLPENDKGERIREIERNNFKDSALAKFIDLKQINTNELYRYFKRGIHKKSIAVRFNRKQVPFGGLDDLQGAGMALTVDWFQASLKGQLFAQFDPERAYKRDLSNCPEEIVKGEFTLKHRGTSAGSWKYFYSVYHNGVLLGTIKGGEMGAIGDANPDLMQFQADNEQLYYQGFFNRFERFRKSIGATFNNITRLDIALDFTHQAFLPFLTSQARQTKVLGQYAKERNEVQGMTHLSAKERKALINTINERELEESRGFEQSPIDFFTKGWRDKRYERIGRKCKMSYSGIDSNGVHLHGATIGGMDAPRMASIYNKTMQLMNEHKPYIGEWHDSNGLLGEVTRMELRIMREEAKKYENLNIRDLENPEVLIQIFQNTMKGLVEFVPGDHPNQKKRDRPRIDMFDFSACRGAKWLKRKRQMATKTSGRSEAIQLKKYIRSYMQTNKVCYLQMFWKDKTRWGSTVDKLQYWFEDIQYEKQTKHDAVTEMTYGQLLRDIALTRKTMNNPLVWDYGTAPTLLQDVELYGRETLPEDIERWSSEILASESEAITAPF